MSSFLVMLLCYAVIAIAQPAHWVYPPLPGAQKDFADNPVWEVGSTQTLKWETSYPTTTIFMNQERLSPDDDGAFGWIVQNLVNVQEYKWVVNTTFFTLSESNVFWMGMTVSDSNEKSKDINAHYHNITTEKVISSASSSPPSTSTTTVTSTHSRTSTSTSDSTTSDLFTGSTGTGAPIDHKKGMSAGAVAGISVGCTAIGFAIVGALIFWLWRRRIQNTAAKYGQADSVANTGVEKVSYAHWGGELSSGEETQVRAELHGPLTKLGHELDSRVVEAPAAPR